MEIIGNLVNKTKREASSTSTALSLTTGPVALLTRKYSTFEHLAARFNPDVQSRLLNNLQVAYLSETPTVGLLAEAYGWDKAVFWLKAQLLSLDRYNGTTGDCELEVIGETATLFARNYPHIRMTEIMLFLARFKLGVYGKFYGSFDPIALGEAFRKHLRGRMQEVVELERKCNRKDEEEFVPPPGYTSWTWYQEVKRRAAAGDPEAAELLKPPADRKK